MQGKHLLLLSYFFIVAWMRSVTIKGGSEADFLKLTTSDLQSLQQLEIIDAMSQQNFQLLLNTKSLPRLKQLKMHRATFVLKDPLTQIGTQISMPNLRQLVITECFMQETYWKGLTKMPLSNLTSLKISHAYIGQEFGAAIASQPLPNLVNLTFGIKFQQIERILFPFLDIARILPAKPNLSLCDANFPNLALFRFTHIDFPASADFDCLSSIYFPRLKILILGQHGFYFSMLPKISKMNLPQLTALDMSFGHLTATTYSKPTQKIVFQKLKTMMLGVYFDEHMMSDLGDVFQAPELESLSLFYYKGHGGPGLKKFIGLFPKLKKLDLTASQTQTLGFLSSVPATIDQLKYTSGLLSYDDGINNFERFKDLQYLLFDNGDFDDQQLAKVLSCRCTLFKQLRFSQTAISSKGLQLLAELDLHDLTLLHLGDVHFDQDFGTIKGMALPVLKSLVMYSNYLKDPALQAITKWQIGPDMLNLDLTNNQLSDQSLLWISKLTLTNLTTLYLGKNRLLTGEGFSNFHADALQSLLVLNLASCNITILGLRQLVKLRMPKLKELDLGYNPMLGPEAPEILADWESLKNIQILKFEGVPRLGCQGVDTLFRKDHLLLLNYLDLRSTRVDDSCMGSIIQNLPNLSQLLLDRTLVTELFAKHMTKQFLQSVYVLSLSRTQVNFNQFLKTVQGIYPSFDNLDTLTLSSSDFKDADLMQFRKIMFPALRNLHMKYTRLTDSGAQALIRFPFKMLIQLEIGLDNYSLETKAVASENYRLFIK